MNYFDYRKRNYERLQQNEDKNSYINAHKDIMNYAREYNISGTIYFDEQKTAEEIKNRLTKAILDAFK